MKIIVIENAYRGSLGERTSVHVYPDTCIFRNNDPFYVPDIDCKYSIKAGIYLKINKIGKCIESEYAYRYISHIGIALSFTNETLVQALIKQNAFTTPAYCSDRSLGISNEMIAFEPERVQKLLFRLKINKTELLFTPGMFKFSIAEMISASSHYFTIKIGDLIFLPFYRTDKEISINSIIDCLLYDNHLLRCQIK